MLFIMLLRRGVSGEHRVYLHERAAGRGFDLPRPVVFPVNKYILVGKDIHFDKFMPLPDILSIVYHFL